MFNYIYNNTSFAADIGSEQASSARVTGNASTPARAGKPSRRLIKRPTTKHGGARIERDNVTVTT